MNFEGVLMAVVCFLCIGLFHPIVIKAEYYWSARCWPVFLATGLLFVAASLLVSHTLVSITLGILGCNCLWSILELKEQEQRVAKVWFPSNPNRKDNRDKG